MRRTCSLYITVVLGSASVAWAQSPEDAPLAECYAQRRANRLDVSLAACQRAVALVPSGRSYAQLALTEMALERWTDAATHLARALTDTNHPWIQQNRASLEGALRTCRAHVAEVFLDTNEPRVVASASGTSLGEVTAAPVFLPPGSTMVELRAPDGRALSRTVSLRAGSSTREAFNFAAPTVTSSTPVTLPPAPVTSPPPVTDRGVSTRRTLAWVSAAGALVGVGVGLVGWRLREGVAAEYLDCLGGPNAPECDHATAQDDVRRWEILTGVGLAIGGALAVTSAVFFLTSRERPAHRALACAPFVTLRGLDCSVRF